MPEENKDNQNLQDQEQTNKDKVEIDPTQLEDEQDFSTTPQKVELDLDDAPFLEEEEEEEEGKKPDKRPGKQDIEEKKEQKQKDAQSTAWWKSKKTIFMAAGLLLLLLALLIWFIFFHKSASTPEKTQDPSPEQEAKQEESSKPEQINLEFKPFQIEYLQDGQIRFLFCKLAFATNDVLKWEIERKTMLLRDAIYYYLKNKKLTFLDNKDNVEQLKNDLLSVVNQFLSNGRIQQILLQEYRIE